jgi:hypothetical protein
VGEIFEFGIFSYELSLFCFFGFLGFELGEFIDVFVDSEGAELLFLLLF